MTRRFFVKNSGLAMFGIGAAPAWLARAAAAGNGRKKILVAVFQRGAADGLNMVVPHGDRRYYELRPAIAVEKPRDLDGFYGLHPSLEPFKELFDAKHLAIVEAVGSPDPTRSHFDAQDYMESGTPGLKSTRDGWMNRALVRGVPSPVRAVALGQALPRSMRGQNPAIAVSNLKDFHVREAAEFEKMYAGTRDAVLKATGRDTFEAMRLIESVQKESYTPAEGATYPNSRFGQSMQQIARLIKAEVGVEVAFADIGGWDHHVNEVPQLTNMLADFGKTLKAFYVDLGARMDDVALVTMSEFGRTVRENGNRGTDHGHANVMFVMGGAVKGGKVYGEWPGLEPEQLWERRDLALTTDFRDVLGELVTKHLGNADAGAVFPGYERVRYRGLLG
jgi:uncharacterized protein (DUF1501 family)